MQTLRHRIDYCKNHISSYSHTYVLIQDLPDFDGDCSKKFLFSDVTFLVEDKPISCIKSSLCMCGSRYFKTLFTTDFKEKKLGEVPLPGKSYDDVLLLMNIVHKTPLLDRRDVVKSELYSL